MRRFGYAECLEVLPTALQTQLVEQQYLDTPRAVPVNTDTVQDNSVKLVAKVTSYKE